MLENYKHYRWLKFNALHDIVNNYQIYIFKLIFRILVKYLKPKSYKIMCEVTNLGLCCVNFLFQILYLRSIWQQNDVISVFHICINIKTIGPSKNILWDYINQSTKCIRRTTMECLHSMYKTQVTPPKAKTQLGCKQNSNILVKNPINA